MRNIIFLLLAVILAVGAVIFVVLKKDTFFPPAEEVVIPPTQILFLKNPKNFGDRIFRQDMEFREWPESAITPAMVVLSPEDDPNAVIAPYERYYVSVDNIPGGFPLLQEYITSDQPQPATPPGTTRVLTFRNAKEIGDEISPNDLDVTFWPVEALDPAMLIVSQNQNPDVVKQQYNGYYMQATVPPNFPVMTDTIGRDAPIIEETALNEGTIITDPSNPDFISTSEQIGLESESATKAPSFFGNPNIIEFPVDEAGEFAFEEDLRVDVLLFRAASLIGTTAGTWSVSEPIISNIKLTRYVGEDAGPFGVTFFAELDPADVDRIELARSLGDVRIVPVDDQNFARVNRFCINDHCYNEVPALVSVLPEDGTLPGFEDGSNAVPLTEDDFKFDSDAGEPDPLDTEFEPLPEPIPGGLSDDENNDDTGFSAQNEEPFDPFAVPAASNDNEPSTDDEEEASNDNADNADIEDPFAPTDLDPEFSFE